MTLAGFVFDKPFLQVTILSRAGSGALFRRQEV